MRPWLPLMSLALVAYGTKKDAPSSDTQAQLDSINARLNKAAQGMNSSGRHQYGPPTGKIRIANLAEMNGQPIGPVDLYDVNRLDSTSVPTSSASW